VPLVFADSVIAKAHRASPAIGVAPAASIEILSRPAPVPAWQVDQDGGVYVPRVTPDEFQVVRLSTRP
jgi:hypothetical protein